MAGKISAAIVVFVAFAFIANFHHVVCNPAIATAYDQSKMMEICIENCAQCKKMYGKFFEGPLCASSCIEFKGNLIPDCENIASIEPFLKEALRALVPNELIERN